MTLNVSGSNPAAAQETTTKKPENQNQNNNTTTTKSVSIFSWYDKNTDEKVNNSDDSTTKSLFKLNSGALNSLKPKETPEGSNLLATIKSKAQGKVNINTMFSGLVDKFNFHVGKETIEQKDDEDISSKQELAQGTLNNKVETAANQENASINEQISNAYQEALDQFAKEVKEAEENANAGEIKNDEGYGDNIDENGNNKHSLKGSSKDGKESTEVFAEQDTSKDTRVDYGEMSSSFNFDTANIKSNVDINTKGGQVIENATNYDVNTEFNRLKQQFNANIGSKTITKKNPEDDIQSKINEATTKLNSKAESAAKKYNDKINKQVGDEKARRLEIAYQQYLKDPKSVEQQSNDIDEAATAKEGAKQSDQINDRDVTKVPSDYQPRTKGSSSGTSSLGVKLAEKGLDTFFDGLKDLITGGDKTDGASDTDGKNNKSADNTNAYKRYKRMGVPDALAKYMANNDNVSPAGYSGGKITHVMVKSADGNSSTLSLNELSDWIKKQKPDQATT